MLLMSEYNSVLRARYGHLLGYSTSTVATRHLVWAPVSDPEVLRRLPFLLQALPRTFRRLALKVVALQFFRARLLASLATIFFYLSI